MPLFFSQGRQEPLKCVPQELGHKLLPLEGLEHELLAETKTSGHYLGWSMAHGEDTSRADRGMSGSPLGLAQTAAGKVKPRPEVESRQSSGFGERSGVNIPFLLFTPC